MERIAIILNANHRYLSAAGLNGACTQIDIIAATHFAESGGQIQTMSGLAIGSKAGNDHSATIAISSRYFQQLSIVPITAVSSHQSRQISMAIIFPGKGTGRSCVIGRGTHAHIVATVVTPGPDGAVPLDGIGEVVARNDLSIGHNGIRVGIQALVIHIYRQRTPNIVSVVLHINHRSACPLAGGRDCDLVSGFCDCDDPRIAAIPVETIDIGIIGIIISGYIPEEVVTLILLHNYLRSINDQGLAGGHIHLSRQLAAINTSLAGHFLRSIVGHPPTGIVGRVVCDGRLNRSLQFRIIRAHNRLTINLGIQGCTIGRVCRQNRLTRIQLTGSDLHQVGGPAAHQSRTDRCVVVTSGTHSNVARCTDTQFTRIVSAPAINITILGHSQAGTIACTYIHYAGKVGGTTLGRPLSIQNAGGSGKSVPTINHIIAIGISHNGQIIGVAAFDLHRQGKLTIGQRNPLGCLPHSVTAVIASPSIELMIHSQGRTVISPCCNINYIAQRGGVARTTGHNLNRCITVLVICHHSSGIALRHVALCQLIEIVLPPGKHLTVGTQSHSQITARLDSHHLIQVVIPVGDILVNNLAIIAGGTGSAHCGSVIVSTAGFADIFQLGVIARSSPARHHMGRCASIARGSIIGTQLGIVAPSPNSSVTIQCQGKIRAGRDSYNKRIMPHIIGRSLAVSIIFTIYRIKTDFLGQSAGTTGNNGVVIPPGPNIAVRIQRQIKRITKCRMNLCRCTHIPMTVFTSRRTICRPGGNSNISAMRANIS